MKLNLFAPGTIAAVLLSLTSYSLQLGNTVQAWFHPDDTSAALTAPPAAMQVSPQAEAEVAAADEAEDSPAADPTVQRSVKVDRGDVIADVLARGQVTSDEQGAVASALAKVLSPRDLKPGQVMNLTFQKEDNTLHLVGLDMSPDAVRSLSLSANEDGSYTAKETKAHLSIVQRAAMVVIDGSLYEAGAKAKVPNATLAAFIRAFSYSVDFQRDVQAGDRFAILYEATVNDKGEVVKAGNILEASLRLGDKVQKIYLNRTADGALEFFSPDGRSIKRSLLRTPVAAVKITSGFGMRVHPLLGYSKMHKGVDFGAVVGTPVFAAGDGVIEKMGWWGGYGKYIRIRHGNDMGTAYAHLSRFNTALSEGSRVRQGQIIALTGSTGAVTGPHLHFEVLKHGMQVNPLTVTDAIGDVLGPRELGSFRALMTARDKEMRELIDPAKVATRNAPITYGTISTKIE